MSSSVRKLQTRIELKEENAWLKNAFRRAFESAQEQSDNAAELSRALWLAAKQNGGELRVNIGKGVDGALGAGIPAGAKLRARQEDNGDVVYIAHIEETPVAEPGEAGMKLLVGAAMDTGIVDER